MTGKHTPGPWSLVQVGDGPTKLVVADENGVSLLTVVDEGGVKFAAFYEEADARLFVAAPDLLEALQACRAQWIHSANADRCLAAITKATE